MRCQAAQIQIFRRFTFRENEKNLNMDGKWHHRRMASVEMQGLKILSFANLMFEYFPFQGTPSLAVMNPASCLTL